MKTNTKPRGVKQHTENSTPIIQYVLTLHSLDRNFLVSNSSNLLHFFLNSFWSIWAWVWFKQERVLTSKIRMGNLPFMEFQTRNYLILHVKIERILNFNNFLSSPVGLNVIKIDLNFRYKYFVLLWFYTSYKNDGPLITL